MALKVLAPELAGDAAFRERFVRESRLAAGLEDPNIVPIYEAGEVEGFLFIAMRLVPGTDLHTLIHSEGPLSAERTVAIVSQVASALDTAHQRGLVHRDVKPGNVLVAQPDRSRGAHAYLTDFGLVRRMAQGTSLTRTGQFMGSIDYVAPEQIRGEPVDARSDVYSLGCLLFECPTGRKPFQSDLEVTVLYAHLEEAPPKVTDGRPDLPSAIDRVVAKAMAKRPADRYASAGELAGDARKALPAAAPPAQRPRRGIATVAVAAVVVVLGVVAAILALGRHPSTTVHLHRRRSSASPGSTTSPGLVTIASGIVAFDPKTGTITRTVSGQFGNSPFSRGNFIVAGEAAVWTSDADSNLVRIDPRTGRRQTVTLRGVQNPVDGIVVGDGSVWVARPADTVDTWFRIDPATLQVLREYTLPVSFNQGEDTGLGVERGSMWTALGIQVVHIDTSSGKVTHVPMTADTLSVGPDGVWVADSLHDAIRRLDAAGTPGPPVTVQGGIDRMVDQSGSLWVLQKFSGQVVQVDPVRGQVVGNPRVGSDPTSISAGLGAVWVTDSGGDLWRIDPVSGSARPIHLGGALASAAPDDANKVIWILVGGKQ